MMDSRIPPQLRRSTPPFDRILSHARGLDEGTEKVRQPARYLCPGHDISGVGGTTTTAEIHARTARLGC
jgi:hypothetical protein